MTTRRIARPRLRRALVAPATLGLLVAGCSLPLQSGGDAATSTTTSTTTAPVETTPPAETTPNPLMVNISIHVEGHASEISDGAEYWGHAGEIREVADAAESAGVSLSFEMSSPFVTAAALWGDTILTDLVAQGHAIGVHADLDTTNAALFVTTLDAQQQALADAGIETTFVSGICSPGPWVEAAIAAGFDAVSGIVEYCLQSMPPELWPAGYEHVADCENPSQCHGQVPSDLEAKIHPWRTSTSADWLTHDPDGELVVIAGESGTGLHCLNEDAPAPDGLTRRCQTDDGDIPAFVDLVSQYVAARDSGEVNAFTISWSIGNGTSTEFATALFAAVDTAFDDTAVQWSTIPEIAAAVA